MRGFNSGENPLGLIPQSAPLAHRIAPPQVHCCHLVVKSETEALAYIRERPAKAPRDSGTFFPLGQGVGEGAGVGAGTQWSALV